MAVLMVIRLIGLMALAIVVPLAISGCTRGPFDIEVTEDRLQVHSVLMAGDSIATVLIAVAKPEQDFLSPVSDAEGRLVRGGERYRLQARSAEDPGCFLTGVTAEPTHRGCYDVQVPGGIRSGDDFQLDLSLPTLEKQVSGEATVPEPVTIRSPTPRLVVEIDCGAGVGQCAADPLAEAALTVSLHPLVGWIALEPAVGRAFRGDSVMAAPACWVSLEDAEGRLNGAVDTIWFAVTAANCAIGDELVAFDSIVGRLDVITYDTAFARYRASFLDGRDVTSPGGATAGLLGATGYLSGASRTTIPMIIRRNQDENR